LASCTCRLIRFSGVERGEACTIVLRGASQHVLDEAERSMHDALCVLTQASERASELPQRGHCGA
jgi:chaperonin GroEL (HSP60 family)